jgi:hypothetical protein
MKLPQLVVSLNALDGHGKTSALLTAPKPISLHHIDPNTRELVDKAIAASKIADEDVQLHEVVYPATVFGSRDSIQKEAQAEWQDRFIEPLRTAIETKAIRTIGLDTATEFFDLLMMADHGKTIQILPELRTKTNYRFKGLLQALRRSGKHIVLLHRLRDVWESQMVEGRNGLEERRNKVDGMYEREGFNKTGYHVNVEAYLMFDGSRGRGANAYGLRVGRSLQRPSLVTRMATDKKFWDLDDDSWWFGREKTPDGTRVPRASIPYLATQLFPDTELKDWI